MPDFWEGGNQFSIEMVLHLYGGETKSIRWQLATAKRFRNCMTFWALIFSPARVWIRSIWRRDNILPFVRVNLDSLWHWKKTDFLTKANKRPTKGRQRADKRPTKAWQRTDKGPTKGKLLIHYVFRWFTLWFSTFFLLLNRKKLHVLVNYYRN